jgi:hypothetical protein
MPQNSELIIGGTYQHYKGHKYKVHALALHSETLEEVVFYECLYKNPQGQLWVRPKKMFTELLENGRPRFKLINTEENEIP